MRPTTVEATFAANGEARPRSLTWEGHTLVVKETGRRWGDGQGQHILTRVMDNRVFELVYNGVNWQAALVSSPPRAI